jgi:hypothetical protein
MPEQKRKNRFELPALPVNYSSEICVLASITGAVLWKSLLLSRNPS